MLSTLMKHEYAWKPGACFVSGGQGNVDALVSVGKQVLKKVATIAENDDIQTKLLLLLNLWGHLVEFRTHEVAPVVFDTAKAVSELTCLPIDMRLVAWRLMLETMKKLDKGTFAEKEKVVEGIRRRLALSGEKKDKVSFFAELTIGAAEFFKGGGVERVEGIVSHIAGHENFCARLGREADEGKRVRLWTGGLTMATVGTGATSWNLSFMDISKLGVGKAGIKFIMGRWLDKKTTGAEALACTEVLLGVMSLGRFKPGGVDVRDIGGGGRSFGAWDCKFKRKVERGAVKGAIDEWLGMGVLRRLVEMASEGGEGGGASGKVRPGEDRRTVGAKQRPYTTTAQ